MGFRLLRKDLFLEDAKKLGEQCKVKETLSYIQKKKHVKAKNFYMSLPDEEGFNIPLHVAYKNGYKHKEFPWYCTNELSFKKNSKVPKLNKNSDNFRSFVGEFREYQDEIIDELWEQLKEYYTTTLSLPPGWGKTMASIYLAWKLGLRTIVIIPLDKVLDGWRTTCKKFLPSFKIWVVGEGKCPKDVDIILCMDGRFKKIPEKIVPTIGTVIADEIHMLCSITRVDMFLTLTPKYAIMVSATIKKKNGYEQMAYLMAGTHGVYRVSKDPYDVYIVDTGYSVDEEYGDEGVKISKMRQEISKNTMSQDIVCNILMLNCNYYKTMCLRMVKEGIPAFVNKVRDCGITCDSMFGRKGKYENSQVLVGTQQKMGTGFDEATSCMNYYLNPVPSNLIIFEHTTPNEDIFEQSRGRVMRSDNPTVIMMRYGNKASYRHIKELDWWFRETNATVHYVNYWDLILPRKEKIYKRVFSDFFFYKSITKEQYRDFDQFKILEKEEEDLNEEGYTIFEDKDDAISSTENGKYIMKLKKINTTKVRRKKQKLYFCTSAICNFNVEYIKKIRN